MNRLAALLAALTALALPAAAAADQRAYGFTYQPVTAPRGALDLELWGTRSVPSDRSADPRAWVYQAELEYGLTDRWDVALYNVFERPDGGTLKYDAIKVESRYRLTDPGASPVDVVGYLEVEQGVRGEAPTAFEEKLILGKDLGRANLALNLIAEQELEGGKTELEWGWAGGASWELHPLLRIGAETFGNVRKVATAAGEPVRTQAWAGPAVNVALPVQAGPLHGSWFTVAAGFGLTPESDSFLLRGILAFQL